MRFPLGDSAQQPAQAHPGFQERALPDHPPGDQGEHQQPEQSLDQEGYCPEKVCMT